jgi:glycosyltransferase involved in cell wall biosynthesis
MKRSYDFVILHQYARDATFKAGIEGFIHDLISNNIFPRNSLLLGTRSYNSKISGKKWQHGNVDGSAIANHNRKIIPVSLRLFFFSALRLILIQPKVIYVCRYDYVLPLRLICPFSKIILAIHTDGKKLLNQESDSSWRSVAFIARFFEYQALKLSSTVFCHSLIEYERWGTKHSQKIHYIPASFEKEKFFAVDGGRNLIVWAGRFVEVKNPLLAVEVLSKLNFHGVQANMFGSGPMLDDIKAEIERNGNLILLHEAVSASELGNILRRTRVLISTSYFEGAPRILIEALACGATLVCVSSADPSGYAKEFPNHCFSVDEMLPNPLIEKIQHVLGMAHPLPADVEHYSNTRVFLKLKRIFRENISE